MDGIVDLLTGSLGGSFVGAIGAMFGKWHEARVKKDMLKLQIERDKLLNAHELQVMQVNQESATKQMEYAALGTSLEMDKASYSVGSDNKWLIFVDVVRGLVRPVLTSTLLIYCIVLVIYLTIHYNVQFKNEQVYDLVYMIIHNLVVCTGISLAWWFGSRESSSNGSK